MRLFLTGAAGQLGRELEPLLRARGHDVTAVDVDDLELRDRASVAAAVVAARPEVVVHPAAFTAVDRCETEPDLAYAVNALGTRWVVEAARAAGARVVYVSTDYVFDGTKDGPYREWDEPNPQSVYGRSKLAGERELDDGSTVVRTSWVCGEHGANMVKTILRLVGLGPEGTGRPPSSLRFVDDQVGHPTLAADLARVLADVVDVGITGCYHATNQGAVSWFGFARAVLEAAGADPGLVEPCRTEDLTPPRPAPRPANSVLDNATLAAAGVALAPDFRESLAPLVARLLAS